MITLIIPSRLREEKTRDKVIQSAIEISWKSYDEQFWKKKMILMGKRRFKNDGDFLWGGEINWKETEEYKFNVHVKINIRNIWS